MCIRDSPYGAELSKNIRKEEPDRMLDSFLIAGLIEARSHERLSLLALNSEDKSFKSLYESLLESEARHFGVYWKLAQTNFSKNLTFNMLEELSEIESSILAETFVLPRVHS